MKDQIIICDKCKHSTQQDLIQGIVYCHYWHHCFDCLDKCGNFEPREEAE